jgi:class 3 adenylate cyclase
MRASERRVVHVLFVDLVGFTTLAENLDVEDVAILQEHYFDHVRAVVTGRGGQVEKYIGDAVLATFGLPTLRDTDAEQAVAAGLEIVDGMPVVASALGLPAASLRVRVGVNTGEVVVTWGADGSWRVSGDVVNTAARLQTAASPGTVLVGRDTGFTVARRFTLAAMGEVALKGKAEGVPAWRVHAPRHGGEEVSPVPMVGRDGELASLDRAWTADRPAGEVVVVAPPGAGKTCLVEAFADRVRRAGGAAWSVRVDEAAGPYQPVAQLLRAALAPLLGVPDAAPALLRRLAGRGLVGARADLAVHHVLALLADEEVHGDREDLWTSWTAVLDAGDEDRPPVWILEDVHLAAPDLHDFLEHAGAAPHREGRLVVSTARPGPWVERREGRPAAPSVLSLEPLGEASLGHLATELLGPDVLPTEVVEEIARLSGGNPLFVRELLRHWTQVGVLARRDATRWVLADDRPLRVPATMRAIYLGQLDDLPEASREVLTVASVAGLTVPEAAFPELGVTDPAGPLAFLTMSGVLSGPRLGPWDAPSYTFRHALLRDAAYATLPRARRAALHVRFAAWLEAQPGPRRAELLGTHYAAAWREAPELGGPVHQDLRRPDLALRAGRWWEVAGDQTLDQAPHHAADLYARARDMAPAGPSGTRVRRQERHAEALRRCGRLEEAIRAFDAVDEMAVPGDRSHRARVALGYEDALFESRLPREEWGERSLSLLAQALDAVDPDDPATRSRLLAATARAHAYGGSPETAEAAGADALTAARGSGDPGALGYALLAVRANRAGPEQLDRRLADGEELVATAQEAGDHELELESVRLHFVDLLERGDVGSAWAMRDRAEQLALALGRPVYLWYPPMWRAMTALFLGLPDAGQLIEEFRDQGARWHYRDVELVHAVQALQWHTERGDVAPILPLVQRLTDTVEPFRPILAAGFARAGRIGDARRELATLRGQGFSCVPTNQSRSYILCLLAEVIAAVAAAGDDVREDARRVGGLLAPWAGQNVVLGSGAVCLGAASHHLGLLARAAGDGPAARRHLADASALNTAMGAAPLAERSRLEVARSGGPRPTRVLVRLGALLSREPGGVPC